MIFGESAKGTNTPLKNIIGSRIEFIAIMIFLGSLIIRAINTPIEEKARLERMHDIVSSQGFPNLIPRKGRVTNVVINDTNIPKVRLPTIFPKTTSQLLSGANNNLSNSLNLLSKVIEVAAIDVAPKKDAIAIKPGAKKLISRPRIMKAIAKTIGKMIPQLIVAGLIKYWKKSFLAI